MVRNCIDSIYRFTESIAFEIICVDGNSPDGSAAMIAEEFPNVVLIRNQCNESYGRSVNQGLACLLDSDTMLTGNAFRSLVQFMDRTPEAASLWSEVVERGRQSAARHPPLRRSGRVLSPDTQLAQVISEQQNNGSLLCQPTLIFEVAGSGSHRHHGVRDAALHLGRRWSAG